MNRKSINVLDAKERICEKQGYRCSVCGRPVTLFNCQLAHRIPATKSYLKKYGKDIIHADKNLVGVCSLRCNDAVLLDPKTNPIKAEKLIEELRMDND